MTQFDSEKITQAVQHAIISLDIQKEILDTALTVINSWNKTLDKRLATAIDKNFIDVFGTEVYKNWGMNGEDKIYPVVNVGYSKDNSWNGDPWYDFRFYYRGLLKKRGIEKTQNGHTIAEDMQWSYCKNIAELSERLENHSAYCTTKKGAYIDAIANIDRIKKAYDSMQETRALYEKESSEIGYIIKDFT